MSLLPFVPRYTVCISQFSRGAAQFATPLAIMSEANSSVVCADCNTPVDEPADAAEARTSCPRCGSTKRIHHVSITETAIARDGLGLKAKRLGQKKPYVEAKSGPSHSHKLGKLVEHERVIDRDNDQYSEKVTDYESGVIIHHCDEPLSKHQGRGSAKKK